MSGGWAQDNVVSDYNKYAPQFATPLDEAVPFRLSHTVHRGA